MKRWLVPVTAVCVLTGLFVSIQFRSQVRVLDGVQGQRLEDLAFLLRNTEKANAALSAQILDLQSRLHGEARGAARAALNQRPSYPAVQGPGLAVLVQDNQEAPSKDSSEGDTSAVVHAEDLLKLVNELHSGGAEAVSLNGHRLTATSEIITAGEHTMVDAQPIRSPYLLLAIGPAAEMKNTLSLRGGVSEYLQFYGIRVKMLSEKHLALPASPSRGPYHYAHPATPADIQQG